MPWVAILITLLIILAAFTIIFLLRYYDKLPKRKQSFKSFKSQENTYSRQTYPPPPKHETSKIYDSYVKKSKPFIRYVEDYLQDNIQVCNQKYKEYIPEYRLDRAKQYHSENSEFGKIFETKVEKILGLVKSKNPNVFYIREWLIPNQRRCDFVVVVRFNKQEYLILIECKQSFSEENYEAQINTSVEQVREYKEDIKTLQNKNIKACLVVIGFPFPRPRFKNISGVLIVNYALLEDALNQTINLIKEKPKETYKTNPNKKPGNTIYDIIQILNSKKDLLETDYYQQNIQNQNLEGQNLQEKEQTWKDFTFNQIKIFIQENQNFYLVENHQGASDFLIHNKKEEAILRVFIKCGYDYFHPSLLISFSDWIKHSINSFDRNKFSETDLILLVSKFPQKFNNSNFLSFSDINTLLINPSSVPHFLDAIK